MAFILPALAPTIARGTPREAPPTTYTINLPGVQDIITIRPLESKALQRERIARMHTAESPLPRELRPVVKLINMLDDAQDLLITALILSKPLLLKLPLRFVPWAGWALAANDVLNLLTWLASTAISGPRGKSRMAKTLDALTGGSGRRFQSLADFAKSSHKLSFALQAPQALYTVTDWAGKKAKDWGLIDRTTMPQGTGVGLQLGAAMGAITDTAWGKLRQLQGHQLQYRGPPANDLASKSARYILNSINANDTHDLLSPDDHTLLALATYTAIQQLAPTITSHTYTARFDLATTMPAPAFYLWNPASIAALADAGYDTTLPVGPATPPNVRSATIWHLLERAITQQPAYERAMAPIFGATPHGQVMQMLNDQAGELAIAHALNGGGLGKLQLDPLEAITLRMVEWNRYPLTWPSAERADLLQRTDRREDYELEFNPAGRFTNAITELADYLAGAGRLTPRRDEIEHTFARHFGGWQLRP